jgi:hypothetical protein
MTAHANAPASIMSMRVGDMNGGSIAAMSAAVSTGHTDGMSSCALVVICSSASALPMATLLPPNPGSPVVVLEVTRQRGELKPGAMSRSLAVV